MFDALVIDMMIAKGVKCIIPHVETKFIFDPSTFQLVIFGFQNDQLHPPSTADKPFAIVQLVPYHQLIQNVLVGNLYDTGELVAIRPQALDDFPMRNFVFSPPSQIIGCIYGQNNIKIFDLESKTLKVIDKLEIEDLEMIRNASVKEMLAKMSPKTKLSPNRITLNGDGSLIAMTNFFTYSDITILSSSTMKICNIFNFAPNRIEFLGSECSLYFSTWFGIEMIEDVLEYFADNVDDRSIRSSKLICGNLEKHGFRDGFRLDALFHGILGFTSNFSKTKIFLCDQQNNSIRLVDFITDQVTTIALYNEEKGSTNRILRMPNDIYWSSDTSNLILLNRYDSSSHGVYGILEGADMENIDIFASEILKRHQDSVNNDLHKAATSIRLLI